LAAELTSDRQVSDCFEGMVRAYPDRPLATAHWLLSESPRLRQGRGQLAVDAERMAGLVRMIEEGRLSRVAARTVLDAMTGSPASAEEISQRLGLSALDRGLELERVVRQVIAEHPRLVDRYRSGEERLLQLFMGAVMRQTRGRALPESARAELLAQLEEEP
jgi:aspartyl-tRNA(Asn)/glutamyl-tRNA(Gln) amidotransferase subunit B